MLEVGVTVIDTADSYGSGACERLLGRALKGRREFFSIATKTGYRFSDLPVPLRPLNQLFKKGLHRLGFRQQFAPAYLKKSAEGSLKRLGLDRLDAFLLHSPPLEVVASDEVAMLCESLISSGKAGMCGLSSENPAVIQAAISTGAYGVIQTPVSLRFTATMQPLWKECEARGIKIIGNHVFDPVCLAAPGITHETLMTAVSALLPDSATILCGTRNPSHLRQANQWARNPMDAIKAGSLAACAAPSELAREPSISSQKYDRRRP
jgi:aryl-alcohol dehydrogenase-like predicted oxidoreductase